MSGMQVFYRMGEPPSIDPGGPLEMHCEPIELPYMTKASPSWHYTDQHGHEHRYVEGDDHWPTLREVVDEWCHTDHGLVPSYDPEGHPAASHYECRLCGEHVRPGMTGPGIEYIPGRRYYRIGGVEVSEEQFLAVQAQRQQEGQQS